MITESVSRSAPVPTVPEAWRKLNAWQKVRVNVVGRIPGLNWFLGCAAPVGKFILCPGQNPTEHFIFRCSCGQLHIDYRHGWDRELRCRCEY